MSFVIAIALMSAGLVSVVVPILWLLGVWPGSRLWVARSVSPPFAVALPVAGLLLGSLGLSLSRPRAIVIAFIAAPGFLMAMVAASHRQRRRLMATAGLRLVQGLLEAPPIEDEPRTFGPLIHRRAG
jgi:hydrogenase/urease accessory protein HupE